MKIDTISQEPSKRLMSRAAAFSASSFKEDEEMGPKKRKVAIAVKEVEAKSYITKSKLPDADFVINPYTGCPHKCMYCYAEFMKRFAGHDIEDWGDFVDVKRCSTPIDVSKIKPSQEVLIGSVTDAYNPYEAHYKITRSILEQFVGSNVKLQILTKSKLVTRDIDLLKRIPNASVGVSMNTLDEDFRQQIEPRASSVADRIRTLKELKAAGIKTCLFMAPIFPGITDFKALVTETRPYVDFYGFENLNLRGAYMPRVLDFISRQYPALNELYTQIYRQKKNSYWNDLEKEICSFCDTNKILYKMYFYHSQIKKK
jgi:DNA repair photolyase